MKNYIRAAAGMMLVAIVFFVSAAYATVGSWLNGKLTASPWHEDGYLYVKVDDVRYTIMDEVQVKLVHMKNGVTVKTQQIRATCMKEIRWLCSIPVIVYMPWKLTVKF